MAFVPPRVLPHDRFQSSGSHQARGLPYTRVVHQRSPRLFSRRTWGKACLSSFDRARNDDHTGGRSEEHTSDLQSLLRSSYAVFFLKKTKIQLLHSNRTTPS